MREMEGAADVLMVADPMSFRVLPWASATGWLLCDLYFADGRPVPFATRHLYQSVLAKLAEARLRFRRRPRSRMPHLQARRRQYVAGGCRTAGTAAFGEPDVARLSISDRAALRPDGAGARDRPARHRGARPAAAVDRGRIRPEPVRIHLQADDGTRARRHHGAVSQRREADLPPPRLSRDLHVPAETAERVRLRLASASVDRVARQRRERIHGER